jgi:hypothetical protein
VIQINHIKNLIYSKCLLCNKTLKVLFGKVSNLIHHLKIPSIKILILKYQKLAQDRKENHFV